MRENKARYTYPPARGVNDTDRTDELLRSIEGKRLTYCGLVKPRTHKGKARRILAKRRLARANR